MTVLVVGLGLIGGSFCRCMKKHTDHIVWGLDTNNDTLQHVLGDQVIDRAAEPDDLAVADLVLVCLYPGDTVEFVLRHANRFRKNGIVADACGVKTAVVSAVEPALNARGVRFVGTHPMAGREFSGYAYSRADLFTGASFIVTPTASTCGEAVAVLSQFALSLGFGKVVTASPEEHDRTIAFTSQLAHVVSNAYVKSPTLLRQAGFSAGSFQDLTRVAKLNEGMWSELFLHNRDALLYELDNIIAHLGEYRDALQKDDGPRLRELLRDGRERKENSLAL